MSPNNPGLSPLPPVKPDHLFIAKLIGIALILVTVCNGAGSYLRKTGIVDQEAYRAFWTIHCKPVALLSSLENGAPRCCVDAPQKMSIEQRAIERRYAWYVYDVPGWEIILKRAKDVLGLALIALSAYLLVIRSSALPALQAAWPIAILFGYVFFVFLLSLGQFDALVAGAGLMRLLMFLTLALIGAWLVPHMALFASCVGALLALELALIPFEMWRSIHLHGHFLSPLFLAARTSGTLVLPNSMGIFAVASLAFYYAFSQTRAYLVLLGIVTLALVLASASATGVICILLLLFFIAIQQVYGRKRAILLCVSLVASIAVIYLLPEITGRSRVFLSILGSAGRIASLSQVVTEPTLVQLLFGRGLDVNPLLVSGIFGDMDAKLAVDAMKLVALTTESTITALIVQIGVVGALIFYAVLFWAAFCDHAARIFYLIVAVCSLTINILGLFPVNLLLGLALAHSVRRGRPALSAGAPVTISPR